jgi:DNA-directed RNA polymerase specialized sigma24 family protein
MHAAWPPHASSSFARLFWLVATFVVFAVLGGGKPAEDPRYVGVDWRATQNKLRLYAFSKTKNAEHAEDVAQTCIRRAFEQTALPWDREKQTILDYLGSYANTEIANARKSFWNKRVRFELTDALLETQGAFGADAESVHRTMTDELRHDRLFAALQRRLLGHVLPLFLLDLYDKGTSHANESTEAAEGRGYTKDAIHSARVRIHRELAKLLDEEAAEAATALRVAAR